MIVSEWHEESPRLCRPTLERLRDDAAWRRITQEEGERGASTGRKRQQFGTVYVPLRGQAGQLALCVLVMGKICLPASVVFILGCDGLSMTFPTSSA